MEQPATSTVPPLQFTHWCRQNGLVFDGPTVALLARYAALLQDWNARVNLISRREEDIWMSQFFHSLAILMVFDVLRSASVLDLGSGGGLPGLPLAIVRPDLRVTLVDSIRKKTAALEDIVASLGIGSVRVLTGRAEEIARSLPSSSRFDIVLARAVAPLSDLVHWAVPLLAEPGRRGDPGVKRALPVPCLVAWKGGELEEEIVRARRRVRVRQIEVVPLALPGMDESGLQDKKLVVVTF